MRHIEALIYITLLYFLIGHFTKDDSAALRPVPPKSATPECWCYSYYNKHAARSERINQTTCDSTILALSDRFEIFKFKTYCE